MLILRKVDMDHEIILDLSATRLLLWFLVTLFVFICVTLLLWLVSNARLNIFLFEFLLLEYKDNALSRLFNKSDTLFCNFS